MHEIPDRQWVGIDRAGIQGSLSEFDAVANYSWAERLARAWTPDATLERISIDHVRHDGLGPNLADPKHPYSVRYRFASPKRLAAAEQLRQVSEAPQTTGLTVWLHEGYVAAMVDDTRLEGPQPPSPVLGCSIAEVMGAARSSEHLARRPFHDLWLRVWRHPHPRWVWDVSSARTVMVDATTCELVR